MKPAPFDYHAPRSLEEATALLAHLGNAKVLAGGQSLVPMMNFRYVIVDHLVDLAKVEGLSGIRVNGSTLRIGAMTRQRDLEFSSEIARHCPLLREALSHVGHRQTRNRGTIGGSIAHADPAAEQPTVCTTHDAVIEIASVRGIRRVPSAQFVVAFMTAALEPDEIVTAIEIPLWPAGHGYSFQEFARRRGDFAVVGAAALLDLAADRTVRRASLALCGVATGPLRMTEAEHLLTGQRFDRDLAQAAAAVAETLRPGSDIHASADYRRHLAQVLAFRALRAAAARCGVHI